MAILAGQEKPQQNTSQQTNAARDPMQVDDPSDTKPSVVQKSVQREEPPSLFEQRQFLKKMDDKPLQKGETWYLIEARWFKRYKSYINYEKEEAQENELPGSDYPGEIDNTPLIAPRSENETVPSETVILHEHIMDNKDYFLLHEDAWNKVVAWYGGGPAIARKVIEQGEFQKRTMVDLHPYLIHLAAYTASTSAKDSLQFTEVAFSKQLTLQDIMDVAVKRFGFDDTTKYETRLWSSLYGSPYRLYRPSDLKKELEIIITRPRGQQIVLEVRDKSVDNTNDEGWPLAYKHSPQMGAGTAPIKSNSGWSSGFLRNSSIDDTPVVSRQTKVESTYSNQGWGSGGNPGVCGLQNLGNTCFMNSALQCLTKIPSFQDYFVSGNYKEDINIDNPLGMQGKIATAFGNLMQEVWSGKYSYTTPREFKMTIGKFAPQFSGYNQQDSQELIAYLLDGLHEDLNRIRKKPITNPVEVNGRPDAVVADEAWSVHKQRNDSVIVDTLQGQLKSTLVCPEPECLEQNYVSITFDPFMYLSVPLPTEKSRVVDVTFFSYGNATSPVKYSLKVAKQGYCSEVRNSLADIVNKSEGSRAPVKPEEIVLADIFNNKVYRFLPDNAFTSSITDNDVIFAYEVPGLTKESHTEYDSFSSSSTYKQPPFASVRMCTQEKIEGYYSHTQYRTVGIGIPFVLPFDKNSTTKKQLYDQSYQFVKRYLKEQEVEGVSWDKPETFLPIKKAPKRQTMIINSADAEAESGDQVMQQAEEQQQETHTFDLFALKFDSNYISSYDESTEPSLSYTDELATTPEPQDEDDKYSYRRSMHSSDKKNLIMFIDPVVLSRLVDKEKLTQVTLHESVKSSKAGQEKGTSLADCIKLYTTKEKLSKDDAWYCPKCKKHVEASKKFDIWKLPEILVVHLKRFQFNRYSRDKIETYVDYPLENLDLTEFVPEEMKTQQFINYDLFAVSNHYGGLGGGHYTAFAKVDETGKWYKFDDSFTSAVEPEAAKTAAGYVLFYKAKKAKESTDNTASTNEQSSHQMRE